MSPDQVVTTVSNQHDNNAQDNEGFFSGISSKVVFSQHARKKLSFAIRNKNELALLLLKLDQFETIRAHYSDPAIEHILITTAEIIRSHTRSDDKVAYFGNGTFAILLPASNAIGTKYLGRRILTDLLAKKFYLEGSDDTVSASIGVSAPDIKPGITFSDLLDLAEQRLKAAVNAGGKRVIDKGDTTITPVSRLLSDDPEIQSESQKVFRQTEITMRRLAAQEVQKIKAGQGSEESATTDNIDIDEINDALLLAEQENRLLKEENFKLQKQNENLGQLKHQLHETDALHQQSRLKLQHLNADFEEMRRRAEFAESNQSQLEETENDRSIIEQHLLQESESLQSQLHESNQNFEKYLQDNKQSGAELSSLKERFKKQKEEFEIQLSDEHMMRSIAEKKLADLEHKSLATKKETNSFALTAIPTIAPIEKKAESGINASFQQPSVQSALQNTSTRNPVKKQTSSPRIKHPATPKISRPLKILIFTICGLLGVISFKIWNDLALQKEAAAVHISQSNITSGSPLTTTSQNAPSGKKTAENGQNKKQQDYKITADSRSNLPAEIKPQKSQPHEEAKLQVELTLRQMAEEEFRLLSLEK